MISWEPHDSEELKQEGIKHTVCPYYLMNKRCKSADVIFMPYNYLIDENIRQKFTIDWINSITIFDEGHNISDQIEKDSGFILKKNFLESTLVEIDSL